MPISQPAVHSIDHYAIALPDLAVATACDQDFGLDVSGEGDRLGLWTFGDDHVWAHILPRPANFVTNHGLSSVT